MTAVGDFAINETYPAVAEAIPAARAAVVELARAAGVPEDELDGIRLAASEALTNAVLHAYPDGPGSIYVTGAVTSGELWVLIGDDGCGLQTRSECPGLGLGLVLIAQISDDFSIVTRSSGGTEVRMRFNLRARAGQPRGSVATAVRPACDRFSTTT